MKRVFISTNVDQAIKMYNRSGYATIKGKVETAFGDLNNAKEYCYGDNFKVIILKDDFDKWADYNINENDYILYHESSTDDNKGAIKNAFLEDHIIGSSHIINQFHDKVFRIIFDDNTNDKSQKVFEALGFTEKQITEKNTFKSKLNLLHKCLSPEILKTITDSAFEKFINEKNYSIEASGNIVDPISDPDLEKLTGEEKPGFYTFKSNVDQITDPFDGKYVQQLTSLRTSFLSQK